MERLRQMKRELMAIEAQMESISGISDGMPHGTDISDKTGRIAAILADLKEQYEWTLTESIKKRREIERVINMVENATQAKLLYDRYILDMSWGQVAKDIHVSKEHTKGYLHKKALESVEKIRNSTF